jgi:putative spermidine/putrescine transport system ATP-binding protein
MKNSLRIEGLYKNFGAVTALDDFNLEIGKGELVALLGPSGCGKTTALRIVAGLEKASGGSIVLNKKEITDTPAHKRNMGMVFQAYSLFPHLTIEENVAFGLMMRQVDKKKRLKKARNLLELVGLHSQHTRYPHQLSGGQQQRVALARALAVEPEVLLLDEPLSALDAQVRQNLREEIRRLQVELNTTTLFVTHDQEEAMAISDRVGVMSHGRLEQIDTPDVLYNKPASAFVAGFVGAMNRIPTHLKKGKVELFGLLYDVKKHDENDGEVIALVRPESITAIAAEKNEGNAVVITRSFLGANSRLTCRTKSGELIQTLATSSESMDLHPGESVSLSFNGKKVLITNA